MTGPSWAVPTNVYLDDNWVGEISDSSGVSFSVTAGSHYVTVDDPIETGYPDLFWWFSYFDAGSGGNPTTLSVASNLEITAHYYNGYAIGMKAAFSDPKIQAFFFFSCFDSFKIVYAFLCAAVWEEIQISCRSNQALFDCSLIEDGRSSMNTRRIGTNSPAFI